MSDIVYAFQPRKVDPPQHVASSDLGLVNLWDAEGEVCGDQCDNCGSHNPNAPDGEHEPTGYTLRLPNAHKPSKALGAFVECDGCGARYPLRRLDAEFVCF